MHKLESMGEVKSSPPCRKRLSIDRASSLSQPEVRRQRMLAIGKLIARAEQQTTLFSTLSSFKTYAWREKVAQWCYDIIDHLEISREVVYLAMNVLDRFLAMNYQVEIVEKHQYKAAAVTSLLLAVRVSGSKDLTIPDLLHMSRSDLQVSEIMSTGKRILALLSFDHQVVTPTAFVRAFLGVLEAFVDFETVKSLFELASYLVEISVCEPRFSSASPAQIAFASMIISMQFNKRTQQDSKLRRHFVHIVQQETRMSIDSSEFKIIHSLLLSIYKQSHESFQDRTPSTVVDYEESEKTVASDNDVVFWKNGADSEIADLRPFSINTCMERPLKRARSM